MKKSRLLPPTVNDDELNDKGGKMPTISMFYGILVAISSFVLNTL